MEEFKNLKEIIELCQEELIFVDENVNATLDGEDLRELRNLINKCKEQEEIIVALRKENLLLEKENQIVKDANEYWTMRFCEATNRKAEQEKIIFLMANYIAGTDIDEDICKKVGKNPFCDEFGEESKCEECVIEFFRKKAKGE